MITGPQDVEIKDDTAFAYLWYPRSNEVKFFQFGLMDVRASDDIRISYDFDRDGWKIEQASRFSWSCEDPICDPDWQEVSFIPAWGREETDEQAEKRISDFESKS